MDKQTKHTPGIPTFKSERIQASAECYLADEEGNTYFDMWNTSAVAIRVVSPDGKRVAISVITQEVLDSTFARQFVANCIRTCRRSLMDMKWQRAEQDAFLDPMVPANGKLKP